MPDREVAAIGGASQYGGGLMQTLGQTLQAAKAIRDIPREEERFRQESELRDLQMGVARQQQAIGSEKLAQMQKQKQSDEEVIDVSQFGEMMGIDPEGEKIIGGFLQMEGGYDPQTKTGQRKRLMTAFENFWKTPMGKNFAGMQYIRWNQKEKMLAAEYNKELDKPIPDSKKLKQLYDEWQKAKSLGPVWRGVYYKSGELIDGQEYMSTLKPYDEGEEEDTL